MQVGGWCLVLVVQTAEPPSAFLDEAGRAVSDDHMAFLTRGIRVIDLIHSPFPSSWHTLADTPEQCSVESLQQIGDVLVEVIYSE